MGDGDLSLAGFRTHVGQPNDRLTILPAGHFTGFDYVIEVEGQRARFSESPENLVFIES